MQGPGLVPQHTSTSHPNFLAWSSFLPAEISWVCLSSREIQARPESAALVSPNAEAGEQGVCMNEELDAEHWALSAFPLHTACPGSLSS